MMPIFSIAHVLHTYATIALRRGVMNWWQRFRARSTPGNQLDGRDARGTRWASGLAQDVRFAARLLGKDRRFTIVAVFALALGIGANTTLFTVVNAICIRGLSVPGADRLVDVSTRIGAGRPTPL